MARGERPNVDLLLTDIVMPKIDGRSLADAWKILHPDVKVLYISGYVDDPAVSYLLSDLGELLLRKPFSGVQLAQKVREILDDTGA